MNELLFRTDDTNKQQNSVACQTGISLTARNSVLENPNPSLDTSVSTHNSEIMAITAGNVSAQSSQQLNREGNLLSGDSRPSRVPSEMTMFEAGMQKRGYVSMPTNATPFPRFRLPTSVASRAYASATATASTSFSSNGRPPIIRAPSPAATFSNSTSVAPRPSSSISLSEQLEMAHGSATQVIGNAAVASTSTSAASIFASRTTNAATNATPKPAKYVSSFLQLELISYHFNTETWPFFEWNFEGLF